MQIIENQTLIFYDLLSYRTKVSLGELPGMIKYIRENLDALDIAANNRILFTLTDGMTDSGKMDTEILIPVEDEMDSCSEFSFKPEFKLINAVSVRHEGSLALTEETTQRLMDYIDEKEYNPVTKPYYRIIRMESDQDCIIDIYVGIEYNIL
ncbi:hypothetical protein [Ruminococcus sp.]|uniref:hypothetical protein n=1 Tax=Ruminococcus sp. TaxID=41978 RepID=UPI002B955DF6|nr:hypothetical protein [Ruminococcus sp.]HOA00007.1 hypothetical protein [Ruminococcus sp.]HPY84079.1 hypothetical protein [Ruminococcus flavefaciens]